MRYALAVELNFFVATSRFILQEVTNHYSDLLMTISWKITPTKIQDGAQNLVFP